MLLDRSQSYGSNNIIKYNLEWVARAQKLNKTKMLSKIVADNKRYYN